MKETKKEIYARYGIEYKAGKINVPVFGWKNPLLVDGNAKIGKGSFHFSTLPTNQIFSVVINGLSYDVKGTCPCSCVGCYATKGNYRFQSVKAALAFRTILARDYMSFVENAIKAQIEADNIKLCRIHAAGDFFSLEYAEMWKRIAQAFPDTIFWTYTKNKPCEKIFDGLVNANIVKSVIKVNGINGFNFGPCDYIMHCYQVLKKAGKKVHICFCGIEKAAQIEPKHCTNCKGCSENEYVLFIEHSTDYQAEKDPLFPELVKLVLSQDSKA